MRGLFVIVLLATVGLRLWTLWDLIGAPYWLPLGGDRGLYHEVAAAIAAGQGVGGVFTFAPLYPYLLGIVYALVGGPHLAAAAGTQILLEGVTALLLTDLTRRRQGPLAGLLAGLGYALLGAAATYALLTMAVALGLFWTALTLWLADRWAGRWTAWRAALLGVWLGLGGQILAAFWLMPIPFGVWLARARMAGGTARRRWPLGIILVGAAYLCVLPSLAHNYAASGQWIPLTAHGGLNFYMGNNPASSGYGAAPPGLRISAEEMLKDSTTLASRLSGRALTPIEADRFWRQQAWAYWRQTPGRALGTLLQKAQRAVSVREFDDTGWCRLLPESAPALRLAFLSFGVVWVLACVGWLLAPVIERPAAWIMGACLGAGLLMTFVTARYRLPLAVILLPSAAGSIALAYAHLRRVVINLRHEPPGFRRSKFDVRCSTFRIIRVEAFFRSLFRESGLRFRYAGVLGLVGLVGAFWPHAVPATDHTDQLNRAAHWLHFGDAARARRLAEDLLQRQADNVEGWWLAGNACFAGGDMAAAIAAYARALALAPERLDARFNLARAYEQAGRGEDALREYRAIVQADPRHGKAWYGLTVLHLERGEGEQARNALRQAAVLVGAAHPEIRAAAARVRTLLENPRP